MKKKVGIIIAMTIISLISIGKGNHPDPVLRFNSEGKFKIVQFTDVHFQYDSYRSDSTLVILKTVIKNEKPDLVVLTGDIVTSKENTEKAWLKLSNILIEAKIPWAITLGNHEAQFQLTKEQIIETVSGLPYSLTENGPKTISGHGNYVIKIQSSNSSKTAALLYCFDSQMGFHPKTIYGSYEWFDFSQIDWYRKLSNKLTKVNKGNPLPALAFFHIPLPEYKEVVGKETTIGSQGDPVSSSDLNSGLYTAMIKSKDVMGIFVGHDHDNNFIGCLRNICLAYGNAAGRQCYGTIGRGARVIELYEGERKFDTWILKLYECNRDSDIWFPAINRQPRYFVTYPDSFKVPAPVSK